MANVAAVSQLMETVASATPVSPSSPAPEHSFATAMQQANQDAGVPPAPAEQPETAKPDDPNQKADKTGEQVSSQAPAVNAQPAASVATKPRSLVAPPTPQYTSANMLSAMLGAIVPPPSVGNDNTSITPPPAMLKSSLVLTPDAPVTPILQPVQIVAPDAKPVDLSTPVLPISTVVAPPSKAASKTVAPPTHAPAPSAKQEAAKVIEPGGIPVPVAAAPIAVMIPTTTAMAPLPDTTIPVDITEISALKIANVAGKSAVTGPSTGAIPAAATIAQPSAATFQQSLTVQAPLAAATTLLEANPEASAAVRPVNVQTASGDTQVPAHPDPISAVFPHQPIVPDAPAPIVHAVAAAVQQAAAAQVQALVPQAQPQTLPIHKTFVKPALAVEASQASSAASQAAIQPAASTLQVESRPGTHVSSPAVAASATTLSGDASAMVSTPVAIAQTPLAITALSDSTGPALAPPAITSTASTYATNHATTDTLQHTTLSSTPTTLEVGVASGTHGWLKIRAELNASGTVDASLTGANAAATGKLHNDLPALSSFLQDERVAVGSLNVAAPGATVAAFHATAAATLEQSSSFTRSAAEGVGATGTAVASDAGASGGRASQQQAPESSPQVMNVREDDGMAGTITATLPALYGQADDFEGSGALSRGGYGSGGSWLNVRV